MHTIQSLLLSVSLVALSAGAATAAPAVVESGHTQYPSITAVPASAESYASRTYPDNATTGVVPNYEYYGPNYAYYGYREQSSSPAGGRAHRG